MSALILFLAACGGDSHVPDEPSTSGPTLSKMAGDAQVGIRGFALGDSLRVRVTMPDGTAATNLAVTFAGNGTVAPGQVNTDADGVATVQWTPAATGSATMTATSAGRATTFSANVRESVACSITSPSATGPYNEGATDYTAFVRPHGVVRAIMLLGDFDDLPATQTPDEVADAFVPGAADWYAEGSYGRMTLDVTVLRRWLRLTGSAASYTYNPRVGGSDPYHFVRDLVALADADVDFSEYSIVYFVPVRGAPIFTVSSSPFNRTVVMADERQIRNFVLLGSDLQPPSPVPGVSPSGVSPYGMAHETGHQFGLPDLYSNASTFAATYAFAGFWDVMSYHVAGGHLFAWQKQKLGWLTQDEMLCFDTGGVEAVLQPIESAGGLKAVMIQTSPTRAIVAEVRRRVGTDAGKVDEGLLVYSVDGTIQTTEGPIRVLPSTTEADAALVSRYGPLYNATFGVAPGKSRHFEELTTGVSIDVIGEVGTGFRVRVRRR